MSNTGVSPANTEGAQLSQDQLLECHRIMSLTRAISEFSVISTRQGKVNFTVMQDGNEASALGSAMALRSETDFIVPYVRDLAAALMQGMTTREVMLNFLAKAEDPNGGGRNMPLHFGSHRLKIVSLASPVGLSIPVAVGVALASKFKKSDQVALCYFGDGSASKGDVHEGMNFAAVFKAPVIFLCSNNGWAISVPASRQAAIKDLSLRAQGYGMPGVTIDGTDVLAVYEATKEAVEKARSGGGPSFIEAKTVRIASHTMSDNQTRYRSPDDIALAKQSDPVTKFRDYLLNIGVLTTATQAALQSQITAEIEEAWAWALSRNDPEPSSAMDHVYSEAI